MVLHYPACSSEQMDTLAVQLSAERCTGQFRNRPRNKCSFSAATGCPDNVWLQEYDATTDLKDPFLSLYIGCNKGVDAVKTLRMGSRDVKRHSVEAWKDKLTRGGNETFNQIGCGELYHTQEYFGDTHKNTTTRPILTNIQKANVFCFEPIPTTYEALARAKLELEWNNEFVVEQAAFSGQRGNMTVPSQVQQGIEYLGIGHFADMCQRSPSSCKAIPVYTLDDYAGSLLGGDDLPIHFLSIDVEGYDFEVLKGSRTVLSNRVHYLEFEYHSEGMWMQQNLSDAIDMLQEDGFVCYWAGMQGKLWRITGCFQDHYNVQHFANVACVNLAIEEVQPLARQMESTFLDVLNFGKIHFSKFAK